MDCEYWRGGGVVNFLYKGTAVLVEGELDQQSWEKDGQKRSKLVRYGFPVVFLAAGAWNFRVMHSMRNR